MFILAANDYIAAGASAFNDAPGSWKFRVVVKNSAGKTSTSSTQNVRILP